MRGELRRVGDDDGRATATTTIGVLVWFCRFGTESVLGFFFFFDKHSILLLVCFDFAL